MVIYPGLGSHSTSSVFHMGQSLCRTKPSISIKGKWSIGRLGCQPRGAVERIVKSSFGCNLFEGLNISVECGSGRTPINHGCQTNMPASSKSSSVSCWGTNPLSFKLARCFVGTESKNENTDINEDLQKIPRLNTAGGLGFITFTGLMGVCHGLVADGSLTLSKPFLPGSPGRMPDLNGVTNRAGVVLTDAEERAGVLNPVEESGLNALDAGTAVMGSAARGC